MRRKTSPGSPALANDLAALGSNLLSQREWTEAEPVLRECLKIREAKQPDAWTTFETRGLLGRSLVGQGKSAEAEPLILTGYAGMKARQATIPAPSMARLAEAAGRVVELYEAWDKAGLAARWRVKVGLADLPTDVFSP
jgi:hypothetical protein